MQSTRSNTVEFSFASQGGNGKGHGNGHGGNDLGGWDDHAATGEVGPFDLVFQANDHGGNVDWADPSDGWWF